MVKLKMCIFKAYANLVKLIEESVREGQKKGGGVFHPYKIGSNYFWATHFSSDSLLPKKGFLRRSCSLAQFQSQPPSHLRFIS